ncbi:MAG: diacylglycerol kinase [Clostridiales bacterium]|nr:diacylglycerol kinase [Clostridiales bacterium]
MGKIRKLRQSFICAARGISLCIRTERNFRIHLCATFFVAGLAKIANFTALEFALLFLCFASVMSAELFNTAVESICDLRGDQYNLKIKAIKDIAAGAVLISAVFAALIGGILFLRPQVLRSIALFFSQPGGYTFLLFIPAAFLFILIKGRK